MVYLSPFRFIIVNRENHNNGNKKGSEESSSEKGSCQESAREEGRKKEVVKLQGAGFESAPVFPPVFFPRTSCFNNPPTNYNRAQYKNPIIVFASRI
jgi:hypothetical protein